MNAAVAAAPVPSAAAVSSSPRLAPLGRSFHPMVWLAMAVYRATVGVATPIRVIFARAPRLVAAHLLLLATSEMVSLDRRLRALARIMGSRTNGCLFCDDLESRLAIRHRAVEREDVDALASYATSERFSERERTALAYVEELNRTRNASDETFAALRRHFSEREIVELTWLNAVGNYLNMMAKPLGLAPGTCELRPKKDAA